MGTSGATVLGLRPALTSFVGRREGLARLRALLSASRLITITGPGGAGKTRLAEEFAAALTRSFPGAIAVAYLADARAPADVVGRGRRHRAPPARHARHARSWARTVAAASDDRGEEGRDPGVAELAVSPADDVRSEVQLELRRR